MNDSATIPGYLGQYSVIFMAFSTGESPRRFWRFDGQPINYLNLPTYYLNSLGAILTTNHSAPDRHTPDNEEPRSARCPAEVLPCSVSRPCLSLDLESIDTFASQKRSIWTLALWASEWASRLQHQVLELIGQRLP